MTHFVVEMALNSLREHPDDWMFDRYKAENKKIEFEIWIANSRWGMHISCPGYGRYGGAAPFTWFLIPWRWIVMSEVRRVARRQMLNRYAEVYGGYGS